METNQEIIASETVEDISDADHKQLQPRSEKPAKTERDVPETENVEWMNKIVKILWPIIQPLATMIITKLIDLKLSKLDLGQNVSF